ncbi:SemiSWEET transporter [Flavobacteriaceae bacterium]|nr:SemiSWEET transporter [Flavobacteriaceae bacterium]
MNTINPEIIGFIAATLTTASFVPQVYKIWKFRKTDGVSLIMYIVMFIGVLLWLSYGVLINSVSVIAANAVTAVLQLMIIYSKLKVKS